MRGTNTVPVGLTVSGVRLSIVDNDPAPTTITLSFDEPSLQEDEIIILEIRATLEGDSTLPTDTSINTSIVSLNGKSLLFSANQTVFPLTIAAGQSFAISDIFLLNADDKIDDEDVTIELQGIASNPSLEVVSARAVLVDDDSANVRLAPTTLTVREGGAGKSYSMNLATEPKASVTVIVDLPANAAFTVSPGSLTFTPDDWDQSQQITVTATEDSNARDELAATINHSIASDDTKYRAVSVSSVAVTDNDNAGVVVSEATLEIEEGNSATYTVVLGTEPAGDVTVTIGGVTDTDVTLDKTVLTFTTQNWDTAQTVTVTAEEDGDTADEAVVTITHTVTSTDDSDYEGLTADSVAVTVTDDDDVPAVTANFGSATYAVGEGSTVTVTVTLSVDPERTVTIPITKADQDGATTADYSGVPENVTFNSGDTEKTFTFATATDTVDDDGESVKLTFGSNLPTGVTEGSIDETVVSITDDDVPAVSVKFGSATYAVGEGSTVTVTVTLSVNPERTVIIPISKANRDGATTADYSGVPENVTFNSGDTEKTFTFAATQDTVDDDGESVKLGFETLPTGVSSGTTDETVVSITDDDAPVQDQVSVQVSFKAAAYGLTEGSTIEVTVVLSADPERSVTIPLTPTHQSGATTADYSGVPSSVSFASGETEKSFTFTATQDEDDEDIETVSIGFGTLPAGVSAGTPAQANVTIFDSFRVSFSAATYQATEGGSGAHVTVQLDRSAVSEIVVPLNDTGMNGATQDDWTGVPAELIFGPGQHSKTFTVMAFDDTVEDDGEAVELRFGALPAGVVSSNPRTATIQLMNTETMITGPLCTAQSKIIVFDAIGEISQSGDREFWSVELDPYRGYLIEAIGADDGRDILKEDNYAGNLTLEDPNLIAVWNSERTLARGVYSYLAHDGGYGRNSVGGFKYGRPDIFQIEIAAGDGGTGSYQIKVRVNNVCFIRDGKPFYDWDGGPDGYSDDLAADTSTRQTLSASNFPASNIGAFLGDNWDEGPDEDWFAIEFTRGYEYTVEVWANPYVSEEHQVTKLKILGIYDNSGTAIGGTASSGGRIRASVDFQPNSTGRYYIAVGSQGQDRTGLYRISATETAITTRDANNPR